MSKTVAELIGLTVGKTKFRANVDEVEEVTPGRWELKTRVPESGLNSKIVVKEPIYGKSEVKVYDSYDNLLFTTNLTSAGYRRFVRAVKK